MFAIIRYNTTITRKQEYILESHECRFRRRWDPYEIDGADKCGAFCHFMHGFSKKGAKKKIAVILFLLNHNTNFDICMLRISHFSNKFPWWLFCKWNIFSAINICNFFPTNMQMVSTLNIRVSLESQQIFLHRINESAFAPSSRLRRKLYFWDTNFILDNSVNYFRRYRKILAT